MAVTNFRASPLVELADVALFTAAHEPAEWAEAPAARIPMLALLDALYAATALSRQAAAGGSVATVPPRVPGCATRAPGPSRSLGPMARAGSSARGNSGPSDEEEGR